MLSFSMAAAKCACSCLLNGCSNFSICKHEMCFCLEITCADFPRVLMASLRLHEEMLNSPNEGQETNCPSLFSHKSENTLSTATSQQNIAIPKMNVMKQLSDNTLRGHTCWSSSGTLAALLNLSISSLNAFDIDEGDNFCFGNANKASSASLTGRPSSSANVLDILDEVELVLNAVNGPIYDNHDFQQTLLEPTPIAPHCPQIIERVQVTEN
jgi:hypothetical protein